METKIDFVISDPVKRIPQKCIIYHEGTENVITRDEVNSLTKDEVNLYRMLGLSDEQIKAVVSFLRDKRR